MWMANKHMRNAQPHQPSENVNWRCTETFLPQSECRSLHNKRWKDHCGPYTLLEGMQTSPTFMGISIKVQNSQPRFTQDPATRLLGIYPKDSRSACYRDMWTSMSVAELFIIAKSWNQCKSPTTDKWVRKYAVHMQWNSFHPQIRMKSSYLQENECNLR